MQIKSKFVNQFIFTFKLYKYSPLEKKTILKLVKQTYVLKIKSCGGQMIRSTEIPIIISLQVITK